MKVNILTEQANGLERKLSVELHQKIFRNQETPCRKQEIAVQSIQNCKNQHLCY